MTRSCNRRRRSARPAQAENATDDRPPHACAGAPIPGDARSRIIQIPKIRLDIHFVEGVSLEDLKGPGHYPLTPLPGQFGNGHRRPSRPICILASRINELGKGDKILVTTLSGLFHVFGHRATRRESHRSVRARSTERSEGRRAHAHRVSPALLGIASHRHSRSVGSERECEAAQAAAGSRGQRQGQARAPITRRRRSSPTSSAARCYQRPWPSMAR